MDIPSRDLQDIYGDTERQISQRILLSDAENIQDSSEFRNDLQGQRMGQSSSDDHKIQQRIHRRRRIEKLQDDIIFKSVELIEEQQKLLQLPQLIRKQFFKFKKQFFKEPFLKFQKFFQRKIRKRILRWRRNKREEVISIYKTEGDVTFTSPSFA